MGEPKETKKEIKNPNSPYGILQDWISKESEVIVHQNDANNEVKEIKCKILWYDNYNITAISGGKRILFFKSSILKIKEL